MSNTAKVLIIVAVAVLAWLLVFGPPQFLVNLGWDFHDRVFAWESAPISSGRGWLIILVVVIGFGVFFWKLVK